MLFFDGRMGDIQQFVSLIKLGRILVVFSFLE